ncbi:MAG: DNA repair exonuclease [Planctomycetota bacterium]|nr:DNA repair exonuclease [Planctomycetota bacterium]
MNDFTFIHAADAHIDSPLRGLEQYEGAPSQALRQSTRRAFENLIDLCIVKPVDFLVLAGDLYDGDWKDYNTGLFFLKQMSRLKDAGIRVFTLRGNHDAASQISKNLRLPSNVHDFKCNKPETTTLDDLKVAIHGQGFATKAVTDDLSLKYPSAVPGHFNIGLLHTSVTGREGHENYAPCTLDGLLSKGYDYWALGHVHTREVLHERPYVVFPGNLQGRHIREQGSKGATIVKVRDGQIADLKHQALDVARWKLCEVDITGLSQDEELLDSVQNDILDALKKAQGRLLVVRLVIKGQGPLHASLSQKQEHWAGQFRALSLDLSSQNLWLEKIIFQTQAELDLDELKERDDPIGALLRALSDLKDDPQRLKTEIEESFKGILTKVPADILDGIDLSSHDALKALIEDVEQLLIPQLLSGATPQ